jgi:hypothetical protein
MLACTDNQAVLDLEDSYIERFDASASGYNCKLNREPRTDQDVNISNFTVQAKYTFGNTFTVGQNSLYLSYQTVLCAVKKINTHTSCISSRNKSGHPYFALKISGIDREDFSPEGIYTLNLKFDDGRLRLIA